jgi:Xaa-Pro aminopeptidase
MAKKKCEVPMLLYGESYHDANLYYVTRFLAGDRFAYLCAGVKEYVILAGFEKGRAEKESRVKNVVGLEDYGYLERLRETKSPETAFADALGAFLSSVSVSKLEVPGNFPLGLAEDLRARGFEVRVVAELWIEAERHIKSRDEIENIRKAQRVNEKAMATAVDMIRKADVRKGILYYEDEPLTSEMLRREIEVVFTRNGYEARGTIVAAGPRSADPHFAGQGPVPAGQPVVIDIFPQGKEDRYFSDMTRTVVKGKPSKEIREMYDLTLQAQKIALNAIQAGVTGKEINDLVCDFYERHGYGTTRTIAKTGFIHSVGHGVGLEIHENLRLGISGTTPLKAGMVVTVEPGLYDPKVGGVRIEDIVVVTKDGCENLTRFSKELIV